MNAKELRIGNLVYDKIQNKVREIDNISAGEHYVNLSPIPLSEEWLLRFGFTFLDYEIYSEDMPDEDDETYLTYYINRKKYQYRINVNPDGTNEFTVKWRWMEEEGLISIFLHVHQLQNIYFALTSEELKPNL